MKNSSRYTYVSFANEVIALVTGELEVTPEIAKRITEKAEALRGTQEKKAAYNAANPKKTAPKGASEKTQATANAIAAILPTTAENAITTAEINETLGTEFTALNVANAVKFIPNAQRAKVIRETVNAKGLKAQKEYTGYFVA